MVNYALWLLPSVARALQIGAVYAVLGGSMVALYSCMSLTVLLHNAHLLEQNELVQNELVHISSWCTVRSILVQQSSCMVHGAQWVVAWCTVRGILVLGAPWGGTAWKAQSLYSALQNLQPSCKNIHPLKIKWQPDINFQAPAAKFLICNAMCFCT